ncbi:MAG: FG-GAP repeat domain-containing protein, partial [Armatimonadota bacterium]
TPMDHSNARNDNAPEQNARIAGGCCLLLATLVVALVLAARSAPPGQAPGAALAHGPSASAGPGVPLTALWEAPARRRASAAAIWDTDQDGDDELLLLDGDDRIIMYDERGDDLRTATLPYDAGCLGIARGRRPPAIVTGSLYASVSALDRAGDEVLWSYSLPMTYTLTACAVADLEGDGIEEIVAAQPDRGLTCLDADGKHRWQLPLPGLIGSLAVGDVNDDGRPEILVAGRDTPVFVVSSAGHLRHTWDIWASACYVAVADLDGNGADEIAVKTAAFGRSDRAFVAGVDSAGHLTWRRPVPGLVRAVHTGRPVLDRPLTAVDINNDGRREWAAVGSDGSLHLIGGSGELLGVYWADEPLIGLYPMRTRAGLERLVAVSPNSARCLEWKGEAGG